MLTAPNLYNAQKVQILLTKLRATVRTNKESENTSQWQREPYEADGFRYIVLAVFAW